MTAPDVRRRGIAVTVAVTVAAILLSAGIVIAAMATAIWVVISW